MEKQARKRLRKIVIDEGLSVHCEPRHCLHTCDRRRVYGTGIAVIQSLMNSSPMHRFSTVSTWIGRFARLVWTNVAGPLLSYTTCQTCVPNLRL